jgi:hypothetical protein
MVSQTQTEAEYEQIIASLKLLVATNQPMPPSLVKLLLVGVEGLLDVLRIKDEMIAMLRKELGANHNAN